MPSSIPRNGIMSVPNAKWIINVKRPRIAVIEALWKPQDDLHVRLKDHLYGITNLPAETTDRVNYEHQQLSKWESHSIGFLPGGWDLKSKISHERQLLLMIVSDEVFKSAATAEIEYHPERFHYVPSIPAPAAATLMNSLRILAPTNDANHLMIAEIVGRAVAARVMTFFNELSVSSQKQQREEVTDRLKRVIDFVDTNISKEIQLSELADVAAMSQYHFARLFKRTTGQSPLRYVWQRRVERAKLLMKIPGLTLTNVALECGFSSQSHFTTVFKRETGSTPAQYRARL